MIYIFVTDLHEAKPFLKQYQLQKDVSQDKLEVYFNLHMYLVITRPGPIAASVSVSSFLAQRRPSTTDIILNVSLCDSTKPEFEIGSLYLIYKIIELESNKRFIPDLLFRHPFSEAAITSASIPFFMLKKENTKQIETELFDMETAAMMQTLLAAAKTHHVYFFRIVAGYGEGEKKTPILTQRLVSQNLDAIMEYIIDLTGSLRKEYTLEYDEIRAIKNFSKFFCLSPAKEQELMEFMFFYKSEGQNMTEYLTRFLEERKELDIFTRTQGYPFYEELCSTMNKTYHQHHKKTEEEA